MKNIVLIGFMGTGKTTVGKIIAEKLNISFFDSDFLIEKKCGMCINDIFKEFGEKYFRNVEKEIIKELSIFKNCVISTGGGVVKSKENILRLKQNGLLFYLSASPNKIEKNIKKDFNKRPLLRCHNISERIRNLLKEREELYRKALDYEVNIDYLEPEQAADKIIKIYESENG